MMEVKINKNRFRVFGAIEWIALADEMGEEMRENLKMTKYHEKLDIYGGYNIRRDWRKKKEWFVLLMLCLKYQLGSWMRISSRVLE